MLHVENLTKLYAPGESGGGIRDLSFDVTAGEFYTLLGPSGCGKTTTLRSVAGLEEPSAGRMTIADQVIFDAAKGIFVPANHRRHAALHNCGLFRRYFFQRITKELDMIHRDWRDDARQRPLDNVGCIEPAAETDFEEREISGIVGEQQKSRCCLYLEHGDRCVAIGAFARCQRVC